MNSIAPEPLNGFQPTLARIFSTVPPRTGSVLKVMVSKVKVTVLRQKHAGRRFVVEVTIYLGLCIKLIFSFIRPPRRMSKAFGVESEYLYTAPNELADQSARDASSSLQSVVLQITMTIERNLVELLLLDGIICLYPTSPVKSICSCCCPHIISNNDNNVNRFFMKLFNTSDIQTITECQLIFGFKLPSAIIKLRDFS